jgi:hypothetical protein
LRVNKAEILAHLRAGGAEWQAAVDRIPLDRMDEPMGNGPWSAKDEIAHVTFYDRWTAGTLQALAEGREPQHAEMYDHPEPMPEYGGDLDGFNDAIRQRYAAMSPADIVSATKRAFDDLVAAVEAVPESLWDQPTEFTRERTLAEVMPGQTWVHYAKHLPPLQAFIAQ